MSVRLLDRMYRGPLGRVMSAVTRRVARLHQPFMVYGYVDAESGKFRKYTRLSSTLTIMSPERLKIADQVWVWHHSILDATEGITIEEGAQIGAWVGIFTHGSERAIRLLGNRFVHLHNSKRLGYTRGSVKIGAYTFIAAGTVVLPGVSIGKGCLVGAGTVVSENVPDYSIVVGMPGKVIGTTLKMDWPLVRDLGCEDSYYDSDALETMIERAKTK